MSISTSLDLSLRVAHGVLPIGGEVTEIRIADADWIRLIMEGRDSSICMGIFGDDEPIAHVTFQGVRILPKTKGLAYDVKRGRRVPPGMCKDRS